MKYTFHGLVDDDRLRRITASYGVIVGVMMIAQWTGFIIMGQVEELESEPTRIAFHLAAELGTAIALIIGGVGLAKRLSWGYPAFLISQGWRAALRRHVRGPLGNDHRNNRDSGQARDDTQRRRTDE
jgi:hypothetical protein